MSEGSEVKRLSSRVKHDVKCGEVHWMEEETKNEKGNTWGMIEGRP